MPVKVIRKNNDPRAMRPQFRKGQPRKIRKTNTTIAIAKPSSAVTAVSGLRSTARPKAAKAKSVLAQSDSAAILLTTPATCGVPMRLGPGVGAGEPVGSSRSGCWAVPQLGQNLAVCLIPAPQFSQKCLPPSDTAVFLPYKCPTTAPHIQYVADLPSG